MPAALRHVGGWNASFQKPDRECDANQSADGGDVKRDQHSSAGAGDLADVRAKEQERHGERHEPLAHEIVGGRFHRHEARV